MLEQILSIPIEKKVGQLFFIGLQGAELDHSNRHLLKKFSPGGVCFFSRNIREAKQTRNFLDDIRQELSIEPFLGLDQEGGTVDRLRRVIEPMPAAGLFKDLADVEKSAQITAEVLQLLGFNLNFAPVVDVIDARRKNAGNGLYSRAFGASKENASLFATVYLENLQKKNVLGCIKHFPGLGASPIDSHEQLPLIDIQEKELFEVDLYPYREILKKVEVNFMMIAHAAFPGSHLQERDQNGKLLPSSLSSSFVSKLLRQKLGFRRLAITDDLEMGAILKNYEIGDACKRAFQAGADMLMICAEPHLIETGFYAVLEAIRDKEISEERLNESLMRIAEVKNKINSPLPALKENRLQELSDEIKALKLKLI